MSQQFTDTMNDILDQGIVLGRMAAWKQAAEMISAALMLPDESERLRLESIKRLCEDRFETARSQLAEEMKK